MQIILYNKKRPADLTADLSRSLDLSLGLDAIALVESLDSSGRVNQLLGTCKERVTSRADFNREVLCRCLCLDDISA